MAVYVEPKDTRVAKVRVQIGDDWTECSWEKPVERSVARDRALQMVDALAGAGRQ